MRAEALQEAGAWMEAQTAIWESRMDRLDAHLLEIQQ
jgi:hypothetical protein